MSVTLSLSLILSIGDIDYIFNEKNVLIIFNLLFQILLKIELILYKNILLSNDKILLKQNNF